MKIVEVRPLVIDGVSCVLERIEEGPEVVCYCVSKLVRLKGFTQSQRRLLGDPKPTIVEAERSARDFLRTHGIPKR